MGRAYGAMTTPHMYVIDAQGALKYRGAVDNAPRGEVAGGGNRVDYLKRAVDAIRTGDELATPDTKPYGCSVKY